MDERDPVHKGFGGRRRQSRPTRPGRTNAGRGLVAASAAGTLGIDHIQVLRWQTRAAIDRLDDAKPGPGEALHALLAWERNPILALAEDWDEVDTSHRKLAHCG